MNVYSSQITGLVDAIQKGSISGFNVRQDFLVAKAQGAIKSTEIGKTLMVLNRGLGCIFAMVRATEMPEFAKTDATESMLLNKQNYVHHVHTLIPK